MMDSNIGVKSLIMALSLLSVENIIYLKFTLLKTYMVSWVAVFSTSATIDEILSIIIKCVISTSGRNLTPIECIKIAPAGRNDNSVFVIPHLTLI